MSGRGFLERLLDRSDVRWVSIRDLFHIKNGYTPHKSNPDFWNKGTIPWFRLNDLRENGAILDDSIQKITAAAVKSGELFPANSIIITTSATIGDYALVRVPHLANQRFANLSVKKEYSHLVDIKYLYHYCAQLAKWCKENTTTSSFAAVRMDGFRVFEFPIPCPDSPGKSLAIQAEIVRILDSFAELTAELTAELAARRKQYDYYRDRLLRFKDREVEWAMLGGMAEIYGGLTGKSKADFGERGAKFVPYKNIFGNIAVDPESIGFVSVPESENQNRVRFGDVLFTGSSETPEEVGMSAVVTTTFEEPVYLNSFSFGVRFAEDVPLLPEFSKHLFRGSVMRRQIMKTANGVTRFNVSKALFKKVRVPIPPLSEQARIAAILDQFDTLTQSITEGLPREIELRQKQYAYYRDLLFDFPRPGSAA